MTQPETRYRVQVRDDAQNAHVFEDVDDWETALEAARILARRLPGIRVEFFPLAFVEISRRES